MNRIHKTGLIGFSSVIGIAILLRIFIGISAIYIAPLALPWGIVVIIGVLKKEYQFEKAVVVAEAGLRSFKNVQALCEKKIMSLFEVVSEKLFMNAWFFLQRACKRIILFGLSFFVYEFNGAFNTFIFY